MQGHARGDDMKILGLSMNPDAKTIVSIGADKTLRFWDCFPADTDKKKKIEGKSLNCALSGNIR